MTPKEKADDLIKQYKPIVTLKMGFEHAYIRKQAKKAALILVNELILEFEFALSRDKEDLFLQDKVKWFNDVKKEMNGE